jgi:hypothetical protein
MLPASRANDEYFHPFPDYRSGVGKEGLLTIVNKKTEMQAILKTAAAVPED